MRNKPVVAIDGPAGAGKSTVARGLAKALQYAFVDTGALYRAVAFIADASGISWDDGPALAQAVLRHAFHFTADGTLHMDGVPLGGEIRTSHISSGASAVARHPEVRTCLLDVQRGLGREGGVVLEGRDIGTVVFPDAEVKFFLVATVAERARRRWLELREKGESISLAEVEAAQEARDLADMTREVAPLRQAEDAVEVPCDHLSAAEVVAHMRDYIAAKFPAGPDSF